MAQKLGMMSLWDEWGVMHPVTVLHFSDCVALRTFEIPVKKDPTQKITIQEVGIGRKSAKQLHSAQLKLFEQVKLAPRMRMAGFSVSKESALPSGYPIRASHFVAGQYVNVKGKSIGKGFQGAMVRWGFHGMPASHGCTKSHRKIGATGTREDPAGTMKGKKMAGRMGNKNTTMQRLRVMKVDNEANCIMVRGCVPGHDGAFLRVWDCETKANKELFTQLQQNAESGDGLFLPYPSSDWRIQLPRAFVAPTKDTKDPLHVEWN